MTMDFPCEIASALENRKVKDLYDDLNQRTLITFKPSNDGAWGATTQNDETIINFAHTKAPVEALAHELLHTQLKLEGYKQLTSMIALVPFEKRSLYLSILSMLDNELQHHCMFKRFCGLGLSGKRFYCDSDKHTYATVRENLQQMTPLNNSGEFLLQFVSIIAPGGAGDPKQRKPLKNFLQTRCTATTWDTLIKIEKIFLEFGSGTSLDASESVLAVFRLLAEGDKIWIGQSDCQDIDLGYFVGTEFTFEEAKAYLAP